MVISVFHVGHFCIFSCFIYIFVLVICILGDFVNCWLCLIACIFVYAAKTLPRAYQNFISNVCAYIVSLSTPSASDVLMCFTIQIVSWIMSLNSGSKIFKLRKPLLQIPMIFFPNCYISSGNSIYILQVFQNFLPRVHAK